MTQILKEEAYSIARYTMLTYFYDQNGLCTVGLTRDKALQIDEYLKSEKGLKLINDIMTGEYK